MAWLSVRSQPKALPGACLLLTPQCLVVDPLSFGLGWGGQRGQNRCWSGTRWSPHSRYLQKTATYLCKVTESSTRVVVVVAVAVALVVRVALVVVS